MPKHKTENPQLQELYDNVRALSCIEAIDGRSTNISFKANVHNVELIYRHLTMVYGKPTVDHPMLKDIEWKVRDDYHIYVPKANGIEEGSYESMYALSF